MEATRSEKQFIRTVVNESSIEDKNNIFDNKVKECAEKDSVVKVVKSKQKTLYKIDKEKGFDAIRNNNRLIVPFNGGLLLIEELKEPWHNKEVLRLYEIYSKATFVDDYKRSIIYVTPKEIKYGKYVFPYAVEHCIDENFKNIRTDYLFDFGEYGLAKEAHMPGSEYDVTRYMDQSEDEVYLNSNLRYNRSRMRIRSK